MIVANQQKMTNKFIGEYLLNSFRSVFSEAVIGKGEVCIRAISSWLLAFSYMPKAKYSLQRVLSAVCPLLTSVFVIRNSIFSF